MKLYYTDGLAAEYMRREFGVQYSWLGKKALEKTPDYIHPDSRYIFEPKLHDIVEWDGIMFGSVIGENKEDGIIGVQHGSNEDGGCDVYELEPDECTIIQRDEKPFFVPEKD